MRRGVIDRRTTETQIQLTIGLEGRGRYQVRTGIRFLDHMLELFARHGAFDLTIACAGDLDVDQHHTVEDLGIALGEAITQALGDRRGINRAGYSSCRWTSRWRWARSIRGAAATSPSISSPR